MLEFYYYMSLRKQINQNSLIHLGGKFVSLLIGLVVVAIMTRYLGQEGFGYYTTVIAFLQFFGIMVDFGLTLTTVQMISQPRANVSKVMSNIMTFRVITSFVFLGLAPLVVLLFPYPSVIKIGVLITAGSFFCITLTQVLTGIFQKELKMTEVTIAEVIGRVVLLGLTSVAAFYALSINVIFGAITLGSVINVALVLWFARKYISLKISFDWDIWKDMLKRTWPMALSISFNLIYLKMDTIILSLVRSQSEVGIYGATYRVVDILTMLPAVYMGIVLPHIMQLYKEKHADLKALAQDTFDALMIFAIPIVVGTYLVSTKLMVFVAGAQFSESGAVLNILIIAAGAIFVTSFFGYMVVALEKQRTMMWGYMTTAIVTLIGYCLFIPKYGMWGAAWMTVFSEVLVMVWSAIMVYKTIKFIPKLRTVEKSLLASVVMFFVLYAVQDLHILWLLLIAVVVYFGVMSLIGGVRKGFIKELLSVK